MINCKHATELHTAFREGALVGLVGFRYRVHLAMCTGCRRYRAQLDETQRLLGGLAREVPPPSLVDLLAAEIPKKSV